jgi:hypothetical protein|tara:strand:- start:2433 stop:3023 length:591 start_codon:yes stop_codon:yes gene_type:complete
MPFWSENFGQSADMKDPKRNFRFVVEFQGINSANGGANLWYAKTVAKPSFAINAAEHKYLNHTFYYPGNVSWNTVSVTLVDPANPDMTATLADIIQLSGYAPPSGPEALSTISKAKSAAGLGTVIIRQLDADGKDLETWTLWNAFIVDLKFGDNLEYGNDDLTELSVELRYDWARVETKNPSAAAGGGNSFFGVNS